MYDLLSALLEQENRELKATHTAYIKENEDRLKTYLTTTRWNQYTAGKINKEQAEGYAIARKGKEIDKYTAARREKLERACSSAEVASVNISVEWYKSKTWGYNPQADITIIDQNNNYYRFTGSASGYGYDKESAAIAQALNQSNAIKRMLYDKKESALQSIGTTEETSNENYIAYGAGYGVLPYFEGGVGVDSFKQVFRACGLELINESWGKHYNHYYFSNKEQ